MNLGLVMLLSVLSVPALAVAGLLGLWLSPKSRAAALTTLAIASSLGVLALLTFAYLSLSMKSAAAMFGAAVIAPALCYWAFHALVRRRCRVNLSTLSTSAALGLFPLVLLGLPLWMFVTCSVLKECL